MLLDIAANPASGVSEFPDWLVVVMGLSTVFICLIALIAMLILMSAIIRAFTGKKQEAPQAPAPQVSAPQAVAPQAPAAAPMLNKQEMVAAMGVAIAQDMGTEVSHIRIHSITPVGSVQPVQDKQKLVAAIGVAIAEEMNTGLSGIRIHSIRRV